MPGRDQRDAPAHRRHRPRPDRYDQLDATQRKELERYVADFEADWDAREERFRRTFNLVVADGKMSREECDRRLAEIHETRLEHERDHRETMINALLMTDEEWEAIQADPEFQENMGQLQAMTAGLAEAFQNIEFNADPDDPVANLLRRNLAGSVERLADAVDGAAEAASADEG